VGERALHAQGDEHDGRHQGQVHVGEAVARELVALLHRLDLGQPLRGRQGGDVEVRPPQRAGHADPQDGRGDDATVDAVSRHPDVSMNSGPAMSNTSAAAQAASRASPCSCEPASRIPTPMAVLTASPTTEWRRPGSPRLARTKSTMCAARTPP
jgi:hypothetical protein